MNGSSLLTMKCVFVTDLQEMRHIRDTTIRNGKHTYRFNKYKVNDVNNQQDATIFVYWPFYWSIWICSTSSAALLTVYTVKSAAEVGRVCRPKHVEQTQIDQ